MVESALSGERAALPPPGPPGRQIGRPEDQIRAATSKKVGGHPPKSGGPIGPPQVRARQPRWPQGRHQGGHPRITGGPMGGPSKKWQPEGRPFEKVAARRVARRGARPARRAARARPSEQAAGRRAARAGPEGGPRGRLAALTTLWNAWAARKRAQGILFAHFLACACKMHFPYRPVASDRLPKLTSAPCLF